MSCLCACFRVRGPRTETEEIKRQSSAQEHEIIELKENVEESEADHDKPLNAPTRKERDHWKSCRSVVFWKCKLWMVITAIFLVIFLVILISLILYSNVYTDEDDYWDPDALLNSGNFHNFSGTLELMCGLPHFFSEDITKRLTEVYSSSPALGRYFRSAQVISFSSSLRDVVLTDKRWQGEPLHVIFLPGNLEQMTSTVCSLHSSPGRTPILPSVCSPCWEPTDEVTSLRIILSYKEEIK
ncbi:TPA-induced transmembrane protein homolog isoform X2 [Manacus candei]|uniref:TPA-induced transmembrane protein homolog isoform X2 n=1 Tax=Manacus candei TaxID=415023 RepID=UPI00222702FF|nr:TPA-induced transmembrane protein homolog isoform X2 [Manacus candei]